MIFETLHESSERGELLLVDGGMCHWHLRRDGQLTIREIISTKRGAGSQMLRRLEATPGATSLFAKCPADLPANAWYERRGFALEATEATPSGRVLKCWRKPLTRMQRQPNAGGDLEVIFCAGKNATFSDVALAAGFLLGSRDVDTITHPPYFMDQDWEHPDFARYEALLAEHRPHIATVIDWERRDQLSEVLRWAEMAAQYVEVVIIIPKVIGGIARLPEYIEGKPVRLGYSIPTKLAGAFDVEMHNLPVPLAEFAAWTGPGGVHLLGGSPQKQMQLYRQLGNVQSVDGNMILERANDCAFWAYPPVPYAKNRYFPRLNEVGSGGIKRDANLEAFRRSCDNVLAAWRDIAQTDHTRLELNSQLALWSDQA